MATSHKRRRGKSLHLDLPTGAVDDRPPLSALFLVQFDVKAGYTLSWKRSEPGLELQDSVEYKSLPSGLHKVKDDLIYFMHGDDYAGISAFINKTTDQRERNALMLAVGALVPLEQGRLGRSWKHAQELKRIAQELVEDPAKTEVLEHYWQTNQPNQEEIDNNSSSENPCPKARRPSLASINSRSKRRPLIGIPSTTLSAFHPARSISTLIDTFGPLIFPLYRAALLRKRILLICEAPVELSCNYVYDISIISNIPSLVSELIPLEPLPSRLQPLFAVGVYDIDDLARRSGHPPSSQDESIDLGYGWIACTTDDVLEMKTNLYDIVVKIPAPHTRKATERFWPIVKTSAGEEIKATQRDSRRYQVFRQSQKRALAGSRATSPSAARSQQLIDDSTEDGGNGPETVLEEQNMDEDLIGAEKVVEPMSWSALAYDSFMWWASAGEKRTDLDEEVEHDASMFRNLESYSDRPGSAQSRRPSVSNPLTPGTIVPPDNLLAPPEMATIAYFHRLTTVIVERITETIERAESLDGDVDEVSLAIKDDGSPIIISPDEMRNMGLDVWSEADRRFVEELVEFYYGLKAEVQGGRIECCGVRVV